MLSQRITKCCSAPIVRHSGKEYPTDRTFYIDTSWDACSSCHDEWPETIPQCLMCGEGATHLVKTSLGEWCEICLTEHASDLMEKA